MKIRKGINALYSGAPVWWQDKADAGQDGMGIIFGCIWDTSNNGTVLQFKHGNFFARFFIKQDILVKCWSRVNQRFEISDAHLLVMAEAFYEEQKTNLPRVFCTRGRRSVPIWTYYYERNPSNGGVDG